LPFTVGRKKAHNENCRPPAAGACPHSTNEILKQWFLKGYRQEDAKAKKEAMEVFWIPGVNRLGSFGRGAFVELRGVCRIEGDFEDRVEAEFDEMLRSVKREGVLANGENRRFQDKKFSDVKRNHAWTIVESEGEQAAYTHDRSHRQERRG
jgi:hypothetical protein